MSYIKRHYDLKDYIFSGASSGSWISLIMSYKGKNDIIVKDILKTTIENNKNIKQLGVGLRKTILNNYKNTDFDFNKINIGVMNVDNNVPECIIYNKFHNLEDVVNCCIVSSYIPFVMGDKLFMLYNNNKSFDGGFDSYPYIKNIKTELHISPFLFIKDNPTNVEYILNQLLLFLEIFYINSINTTQLYLSGYELAEKNKDQLDDIFL
jgi:hypothetical protein